MDVVAVTPNNVINATLQAEVAVQRSPAVRVQSPSSEDIDVNISQQARDVAAGRFSAADPAASVNTSFTPSSLQTESRVAVRPAVQTDNARNDVAPSDNLAREINPTSVGLETTDVSADLTGTRIPLVRNVNQLNENQQVDLATELDNQPVVVSTPATDEPAAAIRDSETSQPQADALNNNIQQQPTTRNEVNTNPPVESTSEVEAGPVQTNVLPNNQNSQPEQVVTVNTTELESDEPANVNAEGAIQTYRQVALTQDERVSIESFSV
ncbi:hypothetical protein [Zooshikella ganghwensis]|uniref:Uncharacterized protein n=1 Tax=Zooshikella ganghwensis TaxID=202772 RepID=A0A4V1IN52_9GAMM|nr:hypothetical protein [Zooshikella ganghwensis]RDH42521.1 hypothetical protein B9G39_03150 [Zooshikella ganghwensis]